MLDHYFIIVAACFIYILGAVFVYIFSRRQRPGKECDNPSKYRKVVLSYAFLTILVFFLTYFWNYGYPEAVFWDENYHIASAEKYIQGVFFQEYHPPLGKMLIAAGEIMLGQNKKIDKSEFLKTDYVKKFPPNYSFVGVRFASTLAATFGALLMFQILVRVVPSPHFAFLLNSFYLFDNALIVHNRSAMLEGIQIFFVLLATWYFIKLYAKGQSLTKTHYCFLAVFLIMKEYGRDLFALLNNIHKRNFGGDIRSLSGYQEKIKNAFFKSVVFALGIMVVFFSVFYCHFSICRKIVESRYYHASPIGKQILEQGENTNLIYFFTQLKDYFAYVQQTEQGIPRRDPFKKGENGSPAYGWPFGNKSINYRWDKDGAAVRYVYLQGNPVIWDASLIAVIISVSLVIGRYVWHIDGRDNPIFSLIYIFLFMYLAYMVIMLRIDRVMYLYHYFVPLLFSMILFALIFSYLFSENISQNQAFLFTATLVLVLEITAAYAFFSPLTYHDPLTNQEFMRRMWSSLWELSPII